MEIKELDPDEFDAILGRGEMAAQIADFLVRFQEIRQDINQKKGVYIFGASGVGKTRFASAIIRKMGYDQILYDAGDVRNKAFIDSIASQYMSTNNVLQLFRKQPKRIAIIMDEIDGMNRNDQGGLTALSKLIRHKKIKKQKKENTSAHPILCISDYYTDKKIRDLMKSCLTFELKEPTDAQMRALLQKMCPAPLTEQLQDAAIRYAKTDIRKLTQICRHLFCSPQAIPQAPPIILQPQVIPQPPPIIPQPPPIPQALDHQQQANMFNILENKIYNDNVKDITRQILTTRFHFDEHNTIMNETDRTIIALLYHENIVDTFSQMPASESFPFYLRFLDNMCFTDYMQRITFQNQIWQFDEMCYLLKIMYNNWLHDEWRPAPTQVPHDVRFTKILTKYSTEYGNMVFLQFLCEEMGMDRKDVFAFFQEMKLFFESSVAQPALKYATTAETQYIAEMEKVFQPSHNIDRLEIRRMYRFLNQSAVEDAVAQDLGSLPEDDEGDGDDGDDEGEGDDSE